MTSGNAGGDPICLGNREALARLGHIADIFLLHNRDILIRTDDSVVRPLSSPPPAEDSPLVPFLVYRRARGLTPRPQHLGCGGTPVLGTGADLKSVLCLTRGEWAFMGQHIGDLHNTRTLRFFHETAEHLQNLLRVRPEALVCDLHPDYQSTRYAEESGLPVYRLQHHFAHLWSVIAEHRAEGALLGLALDGTGYGEDGTIWGGELLVVDTERLEHLRLGRLAPFVLPGGEAAIREPWRIAQALAEELGEDGNWPWTAEEAQGAAALKEMLRCGINCPRTSSCGRLFDAAAAFLGLSRRISYEGQAALRLEAAQAGARDTVLPEFPLRECGDLWELDTHSFVRSFLRRRAQGVSTAELAAAFHASLARAFADMAFAAAQRTGVRRICLSGGVFQNAGLARLLPDLLRQRGLTPLMPREMPAHDGGIALGQVAWARKFLK
jgi:hydrogenase maturation protein HypF